MFIVTNHWGWNFRGIITWIRFGWAKPIDVWGVEISGHSPRKFRRRVKIGPFCFWMGRMKK